MFKRLTALIRSRSTPQLLFVGVFIVACLLRFTALGQIPHGITWDEAAIGYNGYAMAIYHRDEWLEKLPISFRSFGDYKAPLAVYLTGAFTGVFGLSPLVLRVPFAIAGVSVVLSGYWLVQLLWPDTKAKQWFALFGSVFVGTSPWHIHFSRAGFESGLSLAALSLGMCCWIAFLLGLERNHKQFRWWYFFSAVILLTSTLYAYHSAKITTPVLTMVITLLFLGRSTGKHWKWLLSGALLATAILIPLLYDTVFGPGAARAGVLIFSQGLSPVEMVEAVGQNVAAHLDLRYLVWGEVQHLRDGVGAWSILLPTSAFFFLVGLLGSVWMVVKRVQSSLTTLSVVGLSWYVLGMLPAVLTLEVPHPNRSLGALPGYMLLVLLGIQISYNVLTTLTQSDAARKIVVGTVLCLHVFFAAAFWNYYTTTFARESAAAFTDGYLELFERTEAYLAGDDVPQVQEVRVNNSYGQAYIFALFAAEMNPIAYRGGALNTYSFVDEITIGDMVRENMLLVATPDDGLKRRNAEEVILGSDGEPRFLLFLTKRVEE